MISEKSQEALRHMTIKQSRRWRLFLNERSLTEIAAIEGVTVEAVRQSIAAGRVRAKRKILNFKL